MLSSDLDHLGTAPQLVLQMPANHGAAEQVGFRKPMYVERAVDVELGHHHI